jgi:hypothetical protein
VTYKIVKREETSNYSEAYVKESGKVFSYYLYDSDEVTYPCDIQPHYYLHHLYEETEHPVEEDSTEEEDYAGYYKTSYIDKLVNQYTVPEKDKTIEELIVMYRNNRIEI